MASLCPCVVDLSVNFSVLPPLYLHFLVSFGEANLTISLSIDIITISVVQSISHTPVHPLPAIHAVPSSISLLLPSFPPPSSSSLVQMTR